MGEFCAKFMGSPGDRLFSCGAGYGPCLDAYGMLQPCLKPRHPEMVYDLLNGSLIDALTNFFPCSPGGDQGLKSRLPGPVRPLLLKGPMVSSAWPNPGPNTAPWTPRLNTFARWPTSKLWTWVY